MTANQVFEPGADAGMERLPPQDLSAEQGVLGGMMLSKDAIADVVEKVRSTDFYRPAHELIYEAIIDLYGRGEPADLLTCPMSSPNAAPCSASAAPHTLRTLSIWCPLLRTPASTRTS